MAGNGDNGTPPATPKAGGSSGYTSLTAREAEILAKAMVCCKTAPEIDYEKLAAEVGMSNPRSASNAWGAIKKKMNWNLKAGEGTPTGGKSGGSAKRKKSAAVNNGPDEDEDASPSKKPKTPSKPRKKPTATPKKGKTATAPKSPAVAKDDSEKEEEREGGKGTGIKQEDKPVKMEEAEGKDDGEV